MLRALLGLSVTAVLAGCGSAVPATSSEPSELNSGGPRTDMTPTPTATDSAPSTAGQPSGPADSDPSVFPTSQPSAPQYGVGDILAVTGDGLAVREGPGTAYRLLGAERWGDGETQVLGSPYRLAAGERLMVLQGPLVIAGREWYVVSHTDDEINWTPPDEPGRGVYGWIAAKDGNAQFVELIADGENAGGFAESGVGPATTATVPTLPVPESGGMRGFHVTVGHEDPAGSCRVLVTDNTGQVLLDETIVGWGNPGAWWPGEGGQLVIDTDCSWSLSVGISVG